MLDNPKYWEPYYVGTEEEKYLKRRYSLSDRCRYYYADAKIQKAIKKLFKNLDSIHIPRGLLRQYLPVQYIKIMDGKLRSRAEDIVKDKVVETVEDYNYATKYNYMIGNVFIG